MRLEIERRDVRLRRPVVTATATLERRPLLLVRLHAPDGLVGVGEAAPLEPYDGVSIADAAAGLEACREALEGSGGTEHSELLAACRAVCPLPQALAAVDLALWDLAGRRARLPVARLLAETPQEEVAVSALITSTSPPAAEVEAASAAAAGFRCLKVKVGVDGDAARVAAVRAGAGRGVALRLDANGAWSVPEAVDSLRSLATTRLELCEEPVHGVEALRSVRAALEGRVAIAMDETGAEPGAVASGAADAVCLKLGRCGGIGGAMHAAREARTAGSDVYLTSTFDGPAGIAAGLHVAAALGVRRACGLATLGLFADCADPFPVRRGAIALPTGPGLGLH